MATNRYNERMNIPSNHHMSLVRQLLCGIALLLSLLPFVACAKQSTHGNNGLREVQDFRLVATEMRQKNLPLLVEFHGEGCPYCRALEEDFLIPMLHDPAYEEKILIRQVQLGIDTEIVDFQGNKVSPHEFASRYGASLTPTMVFLDTDGKEVAGKIVGFNTPSLFGGYLDAEIEKALTNVRAKVPSQ